MTVKKTKHTYNPVLAKLFIRLLPIQVLVLVMGSLNSIVDGAVAGRCIDSATVGVVGLFYSVLCVLDAVNAVLLGGTAVLCGRSMGTGDVEKTNGIFSLNMILTVASGAVITLVCLLLPTQLAVLLGAEGNLIEPLKQYITGFAIGIVPKLLGQQIAGFLQMERQNKRGFIGIIVLLVSNIFFDIFFLSSLYLFFNIWKTS